MATMKKAFAIAFVSALALFSNGATATIISTGTPVDSAGTAVAAGNINVDGSINFFIPLSGGYAGTFGVGGVGLTGTFFDGIGDPGSMDMYLKFSPTAGGNALQFFFVDLDLIGVNDPNGFLESVVIYNQDMSVVLATIADKNDPGVITANRDTQELLIDLASILPLGDPFIAKLRFAAGPVRGYNTVETVKATLIAVSEPGNLLIFGIGLLSIGFFFARRGGAVA